MSSYRLITGKARYYKSQIPKSLTLAKETLQKEQIVTNYLLQWLLKSWHADS
jgi:hypothetical protein